MLHVSRDSQTSQCHKADKCGLGWYGNSIYTQRTQSEIKLTNECVPPLRPTFWEIDVRLFAVLTAGTV